jgi:hypothetical protein
MTEMETKHWSYLNQEYNTDVLSQWSTQGCRADAERRLGYRFALRQVSYTSAVPPGGELALELSIANAGFAAPFNHRPVYVVLNGGGSRLVVQVADADARRWAPGETVSLPVRLRIPANQAPGSYQIALWLPDDTAALSTDSRYAIQLANDGLWNGNIGDNVVGEVSIDRAAPGAIDTLATLFSQLTGA